MTKGNKICHTVPRLTYLKVLGDSKNLVMEFVNIYHLRDAPLLKIMRLFVISVCIKLRHCL